MANLQQENLDVQQRGNNNAKGQQTGNKNVEGQSDYRRSEQRNDNPESFDDDYESSQEDKMIEDEAESEDEDQH